MACLGIPLSCKACNSNLLSNRFEWSTDFFWINTLSGSGIISMYTLACSYYGCWQKTWDSRVRDFITYGTANTLSVMLSLAPRASCASQGMTQRSPVGFYKLNGFMSQLRNTELRESSAFTVNDNKPTLCLEGDVVSSFRAHQCKCSPEKWIG